MLVRDFRKPAILLFVALLAGCAAQEEPFRYDPVVPPLPTPPAAVSSAPRPLHTPPGWTPARGGVAAQAPVARVGSANAAARVEPRREGYYNAIQIYPFSEGALYQVYTAPGQITDIGLEPGESLAGAGPIAAGDTARWIIGDTTSGAGASQRVHVLVKPTRPDISTNLIIGTDRRRYHLELRSGEGPYMPAVSWSYPRGSSAPAAPARAAAPVIPAPAARNHRYAVSGDNPPWRPASVFDDGRRVYVVFPGGIAQGEMPPIFVLGADGEPQIVNTRIWSNVLIVDRLFAMAELRLGGGERQQVVRILRRNPQVVTGTRATSTGRKAAR
ncbi:MAG: P-type conjugative transfer protein TrbG [Paracoccus sp. (in: a-proteobacteria)]|uniref:P-type conjugative transfer protein TrbG n=1 Tax=Paracoccus sp. TaxID=267 RepID=UPI0026DEFE31|nr:P-type conjugative transfer protein TrbG [Paracoccus sp. (in: a-proteobacteria)]MDO5614536.1 P-type conjugative transfer protein TrbG [Paracoccus sp. (in: a-proteobacteria)]